MALWTASWISSTARPVSVAGTPKTGKRAENQPEILADAREALDNAAVYLRERILRKSEEH